MAGSSYCNLFRGLNDATIHTNGRNIKGISNEKLGGERETNSSSKSLRYEEGRARDRKPGVAFFERKFPLGHTVKLCAVDSQMTRTNTDRKMKRGKRDASRS